MGNTTFTFEAEPDVNIFVRKFVPETEDVKGVVIISHGISEHSGRYSSFAEELSKNGYVVYAHDQRSHGQSSTTPGLVHGEVGIIRKTAGDIDKLMDIAVQENPGIPVILFGHSLGTLFSRKFLQEYRRSELKAVILCGPLYLPEESKNYLLQHSQAVIEKYGSTYVDAETIGTVFGPFNERIQNPKTVNDWICTVEEVVQKYGEDPQCGQPQSISYLYDIALELDVYEMESIDKIDKELSFLIIGGEEDPVCDYKEGPKLIQRLYKEAGIKDVDVKTYPGVRHELLNESNKEEVIADVIQWLNKHV